MKHKAQTKEKQKSLADKIVFVVAIVEPLCLLPQIIQIYRLQDATSISLLTWFGFNIMTAIWIWWAIVSKERLILLYQGLYFALNTVVIFGAILYGGRWI